MSKSIYVIYGKNIKKMAHNLLENIKLSNYIDKNMTIGLKPNLVISQPASTGATTHPEIVEAIIEYLMDNGLKKILIMESSWAGGNTLNAYKICGYQDIAKKYNIPLLDLKKDKIKTHKINDMSLDVCLTPINTDFIINLPVLKGHSQTNMTCALKNLKGCIPDNEKRKYHSIGLHKPIAYLNKIIKQDFILADAINGDINSELGGNPSNMGILFAGFDPVLIDTYAMKLLNLNFNDVKYIKIAESLGIGTTDLNSANIIKLNKDDNKKEESLNKIKKDTDLNKYIIKNNPCSSCYGNLLNAFIWLKKNNYFFNFDKMIYIGQGFKNKNINGIGIGDCTNGCTKYIKGCPPVEKSIINFLISIINNN